MFAQATDYTVHAEQSGDVASGSSAITYTLVDESGNILVDESGNELAASIIETVYGTVLYAKGTDYTVHAED
jgi:hypothetical protein